jgi:hypothetical protein
MLSMRVILDTGAETAPDITPQALFGAVLCGSYSGLHQQDGVLLPNVDRAPLQGPFALSPGFALTEGALMSPIPGLPVPIWASRMSWRPANRHRRFHQPTADGASGRASWSGQPEF